MKRILLRMFSNNATIIVFGLLYMVVHVYIAGNYGIVTGISCTAGGFIFASASVSPKRYYRMPIVSFVMLVILAAFEYKSYDYSLSLKCVMCAVSYVLWYPIIWINNDRLVAEDEKRSNENKGGNGYNF